MNRKIESEQLKYLPGAKRHSLLIGACALLVIDCFPVAAAYAESGASPSPLGAYARLDTYCGRGPIPSNPPKIPQVGCFILAAGYSASGVFSEHTLALNVLTNGNEQLSADGVTVVFSNYRHGGVGPGTLSSNVAFIQPGASGYNVCPEGNARSFCPSGLKVFRRNGRPLGLVHGKQMPTW